LDIHDIFEGNTKEHNSTTIKSSPYKYKYLLFCTKPEMQLLSETSFKVMNNVNMLDKVGLEKTDVKRNMYRSREVKFFYTDSKIKQQEESPHSE
jgi:hypothetical protein